MTIVRVGLVVMTMLTSLACGSSLDNHMGAGGGAGINTGQAGTGGTQGQLGGTTGTGGAPGGTAGTGFGGAPPVPPPRCLLDLIATCPLAGACQYNAVNGLDQKFCFASGETVSVVGTSGAGQLAVSVTEVRRSDGTLCYSIETVCGTVCESGSYTWRNAAGAVVARGQHSGYATSVTCEATGETCNGGTSASDPTGWESCATLAVTSPAAGLGCTPGSCP